jgi:ABC-type transport system involved in cytochrome c biogenesis permease component
VFEALCVKGVSVGRIQNYYLAGFIFCAALLNMFLENETVVIKVLCLVLLLGNFTFASLFHSLKNRVTDKKVKPIE